MLYLDAGTTYSKIITDKNCLNKQFLVCQKNNLYYYIMPSAEVKAQNIIPDACCGHMSQANENEIVALAKGAKKYGISSNATILDLGSRDAKWIRFENNKFHDMDWNTSCASSTGATVEMLLKFYNVNAEELFSSCMELRLGLKRVILIPRSELTDKIFEDITSKKVATQQGLKIPELILPWTYEKYSQDDELSIFNYKFIKLDDENNQKLMDSSRFRSLVQTLPFNYNEIGLIDINDEHNRKLLESAHRLYPTKSQYAFDGLCNDGNSKVFNIPTAELERLGFSKSKLLIDLIKNGKLDGMQDKNGEYCVTIDTTNRLGKNKNLDVLYLLRKQDPKIKTFKEIATALSIPQKRLEYAIFSGEVDIIDEYINVADREIRYINIATPKNQEFIRKVKFEQELEKQIKENQREARRQARIEHKDLTSRKQGVRMALVWEFMPNTKAIGSMLAKKDGYVAKLLAKEDDPNETLTNLEEAKINSYRKEMWTLAGTDELKEAYKKAGKIMKAFSENGLSTVDEEYLPIFERYGFTN